MFFFTSGSTGIFNKSCCGSETMLQDALSCGRACSMNGATIVLFKDPPAQAKIDHEVFAALIAGGTLVCNGRSYQDSQCTCDMLNKHSISVLMSSIQQLQELLEESPELLKAASRTLKYVVSLDGELPVAVHDKCSTLLPCTSIRSVCDGSEAPCSQ